MTEQLPPDPEERLKMAAIQLALADALAIIHPPTAQEKARGAAKDFLLSAGTLLNDKLTSLGITDEEVEQLTTEDLLRLAPTEMAIIAKHRNDVLENAVTTIGASAIKEQLHITTDEMLGTKK